MKNNNSSRRKFFKTTGLLVASVLGAVSVARRLAGGDSKPSTNSGRLGMLVDLDRCIGCKACVVACKSENGVSLGNFRTWVTEKEVGRFPEVSRYFLPRLCNHCENPPCLAVCPTGATYKRADGLVDIDKSKCIGCRHCMLACPYQSRYFNSTADLEHEELFPAATHGTVDKCDFCKHRVDSGLVPACVNTCPTNARIFGDLDDPNSEISRYRAGKSVKQLLPEAGTDPHVFYVGGNPDAFKSS